MRPKEEILKLPREGQNEDERDGREGREEALASVPSEVTYVEESYQEIDGEAVDAAAADVAEINYMRSEGRSVGCRRTMTLFS